MPNLPAATRPIVDAAFETVRSLAPKAARAVPYNSSRPRSASTMWKLARFAVDGGYVIGIGTFTRHASMFFYRGRELDDGSGLLQGSGRETRFVTLRSPEEARSAAVKALVRRAFRLGPA